MKSKMVTDRRGQSAEDETETTTVTEEEVGFRNLILTKR